MGASAPAYADRRGPSPVCFLTLKGHFNTILKGGKSPKVGKLPGGQREKEKREKIIAV